MKPVVLLVGRLPGVIGGIAQQLQDLPVEWLGAHDGLPKIRPVMLSGSYRTEDIQRALAMGATDYLMKPISAPVAAALASRQLTPA